MSIQTSITIFLGDRREDAYNADEIYDNLNRLGYRNAGVNGFNTRRQNVATLSALLLRLYRSNDIDRRRHQRRYVYFMR